MHLYSKMLTVGLVDALFALFHIPLQDPEYAESTEYADINNT